MTRCLACETIEGSITHNESDTDDSWLMECCECGERDEIEIYDESYSED